MARATVDLSLSLDIRVFVREGWWHPDKTLVSSCRWTWTSSGQQAGAISWIAYPDSLQLVYATTDHYGERTTRDDLIPVQRDVDRLGRRHVWFVCPGCGRRVFTLHAPPSHGAIWFRCRTCHGLSYASRQEYTPVLGQLMNRLAHLESGRPQSLKGLEALVEKAEAANTRLDQLVERHSQHRLRKPILILPPGRPSKQARRAVATWLRSQEPPVPAPVRRPPGRPRTKRAYVRRQPRELRPATSNREAFCVRCRDRRPLKRPRTVTLSNHRPALRGQCAVCGTRLCRLLPAAQSPPAAAARG